MDLVDCGAIRAGPARSPMTQWRGEFAIHVVITCEGWLQAIVSCNTFQNLMLSFHSTDVVSFAGDVEPLRLLPTRRVIEWIDLDGLQPFLGAPHVAIHRQRVRRRSAAAPGSRSTIRVAQTI